MTSITAAAEAGHIRQDQARRRRRIFTHAFTLGAIVALVVLGSIWLIVGHHTNQATAGNTAATADASATHGSSSATASHGQTYQQGAWVATLQHDLGQLNYYEGTVDGVLGQSTTAAIIDFQRANGLTPDGVAGPRTMALINRQLITGDNHMGPSGPPVKPSTTTSNTGGVAPSGASTTAKTGSDSSPPNTSTGGASAGN